MENELLERAIAYIKVIFENDFSGYDFYHSLRVYKSATRIAEIEHANTLLVQLAALLHDTDDAKLLMIFIWSTNTVIYNLAER